MEEMNQCDERGDPDSVESSIKKAFKCPKCDRHFPNIGPMKTHYTIAHKADYPFVFLIDFSLVCEICKKTFAQKSDLISHSIARHKNKLPTTVSNSFKCDICNSTFSCKSTLTKHLHRHKKKPSKCEESLPVIQLLENSDTGLNGSGNSENQAGTSTSEECQNTKSFKCYLCNIAFETNMELERHIDSHTSTSDKYLLCDICLKTFSNPGDLKRHLIFHDTIDESSNLKSSHRILTAKTSFQCNICCKYFSSKGYLKIHYRVHNDEKLFQCDVCGKSFSSKGNLKTHYRNHSNKKP